MGFGYHNQLNSFNNYFILSVFTRSVLLCVVLISSFWLARLVLKNSKDTKLTVSYFVIILSLILWEVSVFIDLVVVNQSLINFFARFSLTASLFLDAAVLILTHYLCRNSLPRKIYLYALIFCIFVLIPLTLSNLIFFQVHVSPTYVGVKIGPLMILFALYSLFCLISPVYTAIDTFSKAQLAEKKKIGTVLVGLLGMYAGFIFTIMLPIQINGNAAGVFFGPFYIIFFLVCTVVAIVKHQLFNIRYAAIDALVFLLNLFLFIQVFFSESASKFIINLLVLASALTLSTFLVQSNRREMRKFEEETNMKALEETNRQLQELDRQKTEFLNIAAHQLRTPASVINNYVAMMKDGDYGVVPDQLHEVIDNIGISNQWLIRLANEFLNIAHLEAGQTKYHFASANLVDVADSVYHELSARAKSKNLKLIWEKPLEPIFLKVDEEKIRQSIFNFVENAIKYSNSGAITLILLPEKNKISVKVIDQGVGFTDIEAKDFFKKFRRGKNAHQIEVNTSTGLGLYICRMFVEGHGGEVWAKSEGPGSGSEFGFWIPVKNR